VRLIAAILALVLLAGPAAHAEKRVALVIGNAAYKNAATLQNPRNDATDVSEALKRLGFETIVGLDLGKDGMEEKSIAFSRAARDADVALVYYSGHAMQFDGLNYLMPVDVALHDEADLRRLVRVDQIVADLSKAKNLRILVLDSCRVNPLADELSRSMEATRGPPLDRGLARIVGPRGMIISYATQPGQTAADGRGRNSPYTTAFLKNIETNEEIGAIFHHMTADVYTETQGKQLPEVYLSYIGDYYLRGPIPGNQSYDRKAIDRPSTEQSSSGSLITALRKGDRLDRWNPAQQSTKSETVAGSADSTPGTAAAIAAPPYSASTPCGKNAGTVSLTKRAEGPLSATEECALKPKDVFKECDECPEMIVVPAGSFTMGSPSSEPERIANFEDQVRVTLAKPFAVGRFVVTFDEWDACVANGGCDGFEPSDMGFGRGRRPVINGSWDDAQKYVAWLSRKTGKTYRLLSEAEWEYVARAGTTTPFWWGSSITPKQANYDGSQMTYEGGGGKGENRQKTMPVDSFSPNPWGLYNVHGNVSEWTQDCWNDSNKGNPGDGSARTTGDCSRRVERNGGFGGVPAGLRAASRGAAADERTHTTPRGFRVARTLSP
jgi:formylglycine-generating enzyme required for sulfatase activity/uncharacterized caspase-like protein